MKIEELDKCEDKKIKLIDYGEENPEDIIIYFSDGQALEISAHCNLNSRLGELDFRFLRKESGVE